MRKSLFRLPHSTLRLAVLALALCAATRKEIALQSLTVQPGDTLWSLSQRYLKDPQRWPEILKYNQLPTDDPTVALPGMSLRVPVVLIKETMRSATVIGLNGEVLFRKKETSDWSGAALGLELFPADSVRTMALAEARLRFGTGESIDVRENSLVILAPPRLDVDAQLLKGQVGARRTKVMTASAKVTPKGRNTEYETRVLEDLRTLVQVYSGEASVEAQGKAVAVPAGFGSEVKLDQAPSLPTELPPLPSVSERGGSGPAAKVVDGKFVLSLPEAGNVKVERGQPGGATVEESARYSAIHLQASHDREFQQLALDRVIGLHDGFDFTAELPAGRYWWRIALVDPLGFESRFTSASPMELRTQGPTLAVTRPAEGERVQGPAVPATLEVEGNAEAGADVTIDGAPVMVDNRGHFMTTVGVREGPGRIQVVARNRWGEAKVDRTFVYGVEVRADTAPKTVLPEKTVEERVIKPYVIPGVTLIVFLLIVILLVH